MFIFSYSYCLILLSMQIFSNKFVSLISLKICLYCHKFSSRDYQCQRIANEFECWHCLNSLQIMAIQLLWLKSRWSTLRSRMFSPLRENKQLFFLLMMKESPLSSWLYHSRYRKCQIFYKNIFACDPSSEFTVKPFRW